MIIRNLLSTMHHKALHNMSSGGSKALTLLLVGAVSWYGAVKFWQPLIIDQLKKDGNLKEGVYVPDTSDQPKSWSDLKNKVSESLHPNSITPPAEAADKAVTETK